MNQNALLTEIKTEIQNSSAVTILDDLKINSDELTACIGGNQLAVNLVSLNADAVSVGAGNSDVGTQRFTLANDDTLKNPVKVMSGFGAPDLYVGNSTNCQVVGAVRNDASGVVGGTDQCFTPLSVDQNGRLYVDLKRVGGTAVSVNSGNKDNGCIRVCGAADDTAWTKLSALTNSQITYAGSGTKVFGMGTRDTNTVGFAPLGIGLARWDFSTTSGTNMFLSTGPGNVADDPSYTGGDTATAHAAFRVCIATDDVNMASINSNIATMQGDIATIKTILNDVWDSVSHYLRTHAV